MFVSVCNPAWQVKELLMQNPQTYLLGFFAWNHPQMSPIRPFWCAHENIALMAPSCEAKALQICWETELLLTGAKIPWILFTDYVAAIENEIQSQIETEPLE